SGLRPSLRKNKPPLQGSSLVKTIATCYCNLPLFLFENSIRNKNYGKPCSNGAEKHHSLV
ncbi:MAG: hypothetical protein IKJ99_00855, partial [Oscillospiraceae bacterium]|nr:hypothetical protein [Oscillospiraceae bacterium]